VSAVAPDLGDARTEFAPEELHMSGGYLAVTVGVDPGSLAAGALDDRVGIGAVVRRVVSAKVADRHVVEALTQETLVRVAGAERKLTPELMQAYAIVTARHLVLDHANSTSMEQRHQHRLVDSTPLDGPEQLTLEREETDALAAALEMSDPEDRALVVRHESDRVSTEVIASDAGVCRRAVVMRLGSSSGRAAPRVRVGGPPVAGRERQQDQTAPSRGDVTRRSHNAAQISCRFDRTRWTLMSWNRGAAASDGAGRGRCRCVRRTNSSAQAAPHRAGPTDAAAAPARFRSDDVDRGDVAQGLTDDARDQFGEPEL
jgi:DNA-directed RNA polymerase specialized sigma24 family protein